MDLGELMKKLGQTWPARLVKDVTAAAMFPGRVYVSETPVSTEEMIQRWPAAELDLPKRERRASSVVD